MKLFLHGPRAGQTIKIREWQFVDGVIELPSLPKYLEKYYNVRDYPESNLDVLSNETQVQETKTNDQEELNKLVQQKKEEFKIEKLKSQKDFAQFGSYKAYVKEVTGQSPKNKVQANSFMKEYAEVNNLTFEE